MEMEDEARPRPNYAELFSHRRCLAIVGCTKYKL
jgi:hypothetical protein